jgi:putative membrane protein
MFLNFFHTCNRHTIRILLWTTLIGGIISSLVKSGAETAMPPRVFGEISPPAVHINAWLGGLNMDAHSLDYLYQGSTIMGAVVLYHWLFSFVFTFFYVFIAIFTPKIRIWYGAFYGIVMTLFIHGLCIPLLGLRYPVYAHGKTGWLWNLNQAELLSELIGHIFWAMSIEISLIATLAIFMQKSYAAGTAFDYNKQISEA